VQTEDLRSLSRVGTFDSPRMLIAKGCGSAQFPDTTECMQGEVRAIGPIAKILRKHFLVVI
jgi:hypothetical protein